MPRHHVVPQMYLRRFADDEGQIVMTSRQKPEERHRSSVARACREVGYYRIPAVDLEESARAGHDLEVVERLLSEIEGTAIFASANSSTADVRPPAKFGSG